jgi:hypothetical protein
MATGSIEHTAPSEGKANNFPPITNIMRTHDLHQTEKKLVQAFRAPARALNPFLITERQDEKQLCISSRNLHVNDFALLKTLGTGQDPPFAL